MDWLRFTFYALGIELLQMKKRLVELYGVNDPVEICLKTVQGESWQPGRVIQHDNPGVWVETVGGSHWFVTNRQRIRKAEPDE